MKFASLLRISAGCLLTIGTAFASQSSIPPARARIMADSLLQSLPLASTANDSLAILNDVFDLRDRAYRDTIGREIVELALRSNNEAIGLDAVRNLANLHMRNDSLLKIDMQLAQRFPRSEDRSETEAFVAMTQNMCAVRYCSDEEKEKQLHALLREANLGSNDIYKNIEMLHAISLYISETFQGELLSKYLDRLGHLIDKLRPEAIALRNSFLVQAAMAYNATDEPEKAIEADIRLLKNIDRLEQGASGMKRRFRAYDANRYIAYTRLLSNYTHLPDKAVEKYYKGAMQCVASDSVVSTTNRISMRPQIYYAMYRKDYPHALEMLKSAVDFPYNAPTRRQLLRMMITAAEKTGDSATLLAASREYNKVLEDKLNKTKEQKYKELQMVYDINQMRAAHSREAIKLQTRLTWVSISAASLLLIALVLILWLWIRSSRKAKKLSSTVKSLEDETTDLQTKFEEAMRERDEAQSANRIKTDFIQNMSNEVTGPLHIISEYTNLIVDCSEAIDKPYLRHFADMLTLNADMVKATVDDVVDLSEIDTSKVKLHLKREQLLPLCNIAIESVRHKLQPGVVAELEPELPEVSLCTDRYRLMRIFNQLLSNAAKFTSEGRITLGYTVNTHEKTVSIRISDTGIGIKPENAEEIFQRFVKLNKASQGMGIGLAIARYFADLLGGSIFVDLSYTEGAQFVVTLPLN